MNPSKSIGVVAVLAGVAAAVVLVSAAPAIAQGVTPAQLQEQGWRCFVPPNLPDTIVCGNPAKGLPPVPPDPHGGPSYSFLLFTLDGTFRATVHMIRADLYRGQPCPQTGSDYLFNPANGYYRCEVSTR
jgi:hypothetical protein